jgi:hypothetical protein
MCGVESCPVGWVGAIGVEKQFRLTEVQQVSNVRLVSGI